MSGDISKDFEAFFMEHEIRNMPQDIGQIECVNQTVVALTKRMLEAQKLKN